MLRRIVSLADGWFPQFRPDERGEEILQRLFTYSQNAGRDPSSIGIEGRVSIAGRGPDDWANEVYAWQRMGATHLGVNTMGAGFKSIDQHLNSLRAFLEACNP